MEKVALLIILCICPSYQIQSEFLLVAFGDRIDRIDPETAQIDIIHYVKNATAEAVDFDIKHNCLFYSVSKSAKIFQKCLDGNLTENIIVDNVNISGLSYDWTSELLYFISTNKIEVVKILHSEDVAMKRNYMRRTIINGLDEVFFKRDILADPVNKHLFWTNRRYRSQDIYRSNMDGSDMKIFMNNSFVGQPTRLSMDYSSNRIYWLDEREYVIGSSDLNGESIEKWGKKSWNFVETYPTMTEVGVSKNRVFLYEKTSRSLYVGNRDNGHTNKFYEDHRLVTAFKLVSSVNRPKVEYNAVEHCNCSHLCFKILDTSFTCRCPDGMVLNATGECECSNGGISRADGFCAGRVSDNEFYCLNRQRIPVRWVCNGYGSCEDGSDEQNCQKKPFVFAKIIVC